ncbi:hypothetical protein [Emticicia sp. TH156]|uniref:hypothetical protein n=1 Tax=Emticicia sp. TH156 TaxID=2067454 RepID=UPI000C7644F9|nr:hypothetical protein [Emticicia sp. TH156]PLK44496.1 hypothetical protein C0V77_11985 [Emticicia sp. TH156]
MAIGVSPLVDAEGEVLVKKEGADHFAKVFKRKVGNQMQYLWFTTDATGKPLNRGGQVKGTSLEESLTEAKLNMPVVYRAVPVLENPNLNWEQTVLPGLISGLTDIPNMNSLGLSVFPSAPVSPSGNIRAELWWGDAPLFRGNAEGIRALGLATAFDHNRAFDTTAMPVSERYTWNIPPERYAFDSVEQNEINGAGEYNINMFGAGGTRRDKNNNVIKIPRVHWDIELGSWTEAKAAAFYKGFHNAALADNPDFVSIVYGKPAVRQYRAFWRQSSFYYDGDAVPDRQKLYPFMKAGVNYQEPSGAIDAYFQHKNIYFNILYSYPSAPLPLSTAMYKKSGGAIVNDGSGERDFVDHGFDEVQRGLNMHWSPNEGHENDPVNDDQGPYKHWIHEAFLAVYGGYAHYANAVFNLRAFAGSNDISHVINGPYKTCWMLRTTNESNSWTNAYRPLDRYTTKLYVVMGFMFTDKVLWWAGWTGTLGFTDDGSGLYPLTNEGSALTQAGIEGLDPYPKNVHLGAERQSLAISYAIRMKNRDFGLYGSNDQLCVFTDPMQIQPRAELIGLGRLRANHLDILLAEPRLEAGETLSVTIGNTVNGVTFTRVLNEGGIKDPLWETFTFPGAGNLTPGQVWIQYTSIKGVAVKKNGLHGDV